ncbi:MAG: hypothetical protein WB561_05475 [Terracidiphilus sp.]
MKRLAVGFLVVVLAARCHAQIPPSHAPWVSISWHAPPARHGWGGCTAKSPCSYVISRATIVSGARSCPPTSGTFYTKVGTTSNNALTFSDTTVSRGTKYCWIVQTQQGSAPVLTSQPSTPSNHGVPLLIPMVPLAPAIPNTPGLVDDL